MKTIEYGNPKAPVVLIQPISAQPPEEMARETAEIRRLAGVDFHLIAIQVDDWNMDLSPWKAPAVFGNQGFGGGAAATLAEALKHARADGKTTIIGGYSLAGLFALWAACQTDAFQGVAAASPSIWFPGFTDYMRARDIRARSVYLSLGDKESRTRNPLMATAGERIREAYDLLKERNLDCILEWNPGNHFKDADKRTAKAFAWVMESVSRVSR